MSKISKIARYLKRNYTYSSRELYESLAVHPSTLRSWVKDKSHPLEVVQKRPLLVFSETLRVHLREKDKRRKIPTKANEIACFCCRKSKVPLENKAYFQPQGLRTLLQAICPDCKVVMNKAQSTKKLASTPPLLRRITMQELNILRLTSSNENTHLKDNRKTVSNECENNQPKTKQLKLI